MSKFNIDDIITIRPDINVAIMLHDMFDQTRRSQDKLDGLYALLFFDVVSGTRFRVTSLNYGRAHLTVEATRLEGFSKPAETCLDSDAGRVSYWYTESFYNFLERLKERIFYDF